MTVTLKPFPTATARRRPQLTINFGPQHPAAHGVLRLVLDLDGEIVTRVDPAYRAAASRHRKADRAQDLSAGDPLFRPAGLCRADEPGACLLPGDRKAARPRSAARAANISACSIARSAASSIICCNVTTQAMDVGALTPPLWGFEEREKLMVFYERASGSRMHAAYFRAGGVHQDLPPGLADDIYEILRALPQGAGRYRRPADRKPHLQAAQCRYRRRQPRRGRDVGHVGRDAAFDRRAWDLRRAQPYECYTELDFKIPIGKNGDNYDRYLMRMEEMREANKIMKQCIEKMPSGPVIIRGRQDRAAQARRDEDLDGSADPSFQALHRRLSTFRPAKFMRRSKRPRASSASIWSPTAPTSPIAAKSARRLSCICRRWITCAGPHAGRRLRRAGLARHRVRGGGPVTMHPIAIVQKQLDAYNAQDLDAYVACYAQDCVVSGLNGAVTETGREAMRRAMPRRLRRSRKTKPI